MYRLGYEWVFIATFGLQVLMLPINWILLFLVKKEVKVHQDDIPEAGEQIEAFLSSKSAMEREDSESSAMLRDIK